jgi:hypothetical protein
MASSTVTAVWGDVDMILSGHFCHSGNTVGIFFGHLDSRALTDCLPAELQYGNIFLTIIGPFRPISDLDFAIFRSNRYDYR